MNLSLVTFIQEFVNDCLKVPLGQKNFPGGMPISVTKKSLPMIFGDFQKRQKCFKMYVATPKADGIRCFLGFVEWKGHPLIFVIDRRFGNEQQGIGVWNQEHLSNMIPMDFFKQTSLFDIEWIQKTNKIVLFDCIQYAGSNIRCLNYLLRLDLCRLFLTNFKHCQVDEMKQPEGSIPSKIPYLKVYMKDMFCIEPQLAFPPQNLNYLRNNPTSHDIDGIIFTLTTNPVPVFRNNLETLLKWKPISHLTIDFLVQPKEWKSEVPLRQNLPYIDNKYRTLCDSHLKLWIVHKKEYIWFSNIQEDKSVYTQPGVYEFSWDYERRQWIFKNARTQKLLPNGLNTVSRTLGNIEEKLSFEELIQFIHKQP